MRFGNEDGRMVWVYMDESGWVVVYSDVPGHVSNPKLYPSQQEAIEAGRILSREKV